MKKNEVRKKIVKQMKMNGYADVEEKDDSTIYAYKVNVPGLLFETSGMMIMIDYSALSFYGFYDINNRSKKENLDFISYINDLNKTALTTRFYTIEDNKIEFVASYIGLYSRDRFAHFIRLWEHDTINLLNDHQDSLKFFGTDEQVAIQSAIEYDSMGLTAIA